MNEQDYWAEFLQLPAFSSSIRFATVNSTLLFFPQVEHESRDSVPNWNAALMLASMVTATAPEAAQSGALRITQGCIQDESASTEQKHAATYVLQRLGNQRAAQLAVQKQLIAAHDTTPPAGPLSLDLIRRKLEMEIDLGDGALAVNGFQRQFWSAVSENHWVSLSAPTSAGKSHVVKLWIQTQIKRFAKYRAVYLVPTRALIDEVSRDLVTALAGSASVISLPWDTRIGTRQHEVYVLTQERLHVLLQRQSEMQFDLVFVDEAQKVSDGNRGVLLQRVLDKLTARQTPQIIFASPLTSNPEVLIGGVDGTATAITSESVTVNQTLLYANQRPYQPKRWNLTLADGSDLVELGSFELPAKPSPRSKRLPYVAVALGMGHSGNVVYANGAAEAEKYAGQIFEAVGNGADVSADDEVLEVIELVEKTIHPRYLLAQYLKRGVAFHYGNMPLLIREHVERLFRTGKVNYLVCTSTLLEGVNLPCQNLFVRAPKKGNNKAMSAPDFWNLAGRAGRWGVEFQGNIVCVDTDDGSWEEVPIRRVKQPIVRATDSTRDRFDQLLQYVTSGTPVTTSQAEPMLESLFSIFASARRRRTPLNSLRWLNLTDSQASSLSDAIDAALQKVDLPESVLENHAGISPLAMQRLHDLFRESGQPADTFQLAPPESSDAVTTYIRALSLINTMLGGGFSSIPSRQFALALLFVEWMRGRPISVLISSRISYLRRSGRSYSLPSEIRFVLKDVEQFARFEGPLYLACYSELLHYASPEPAGRPQQDIAMMMELGVSRTTELSMMSLGLSRTSAVALSEYVVEDELDSEECLAWIRTHDLEALGLPALIVEELRSISALPSHG